MRMQYIKRSMWEGTCLTSMKLSTGYIPRAEFVSIMNNKKNIYIFYYQFIEIKCPSTHGIQLCILQIKRRENLSSALI